MFQVYSTRGFDPKLKVCSFLFKAFICVFFFFFFVFFSKQQKCQFRKEVLLQKEKWKHSVRKQKCGKMF